MPLPKLPILASGALSWTGTIPQRPFAYKTTVLGGSDTSWAGVPEAWVDRTDHSLILNIRLWESEWPGLRAVLLYAQRNAAVLEVTPDSLVPSTSYDTYLVKPAIGEELAPARGETFGTLDLQIEVRTTDGSQIDPEYF